jgi:DNA polymerase
MADSHPVDALRQWLRQRIEAGEKISLAAPLQDGAEPATDGPALAVSASDDAAAAAPAQASPAQLDAGASGSSDSLEKIAAEVRACTGCPLHETRTQAVPGVGPDAAGLVFVGEGPGADEDAQGEPFVCRAGQLLTRIIESVNLERREVFITNIVKCRPPNNRDPRPDEVAACEPFLKRQLQVLQPSVICALGLHAATTLLHKQDSMARLRTGEHFYEGVRVFPTYHPAALLRNPQWKRPVWEDIQIIRRTYDASRENP